MLDIIFVLLFKITDQCMTRRLAGVRMIAGTPVMLFAGDPVGHMHSLDLFAIRCIQHMAQQAPKRLSSLLKPALWCKGHLLCSFSKDIRRLYRMVIFIRHYFLKISPSMHKQAHANKMGTNGRCRA